MQWVVTAGNETFVVDAGSERDARITATNATRNFPFSFRLEMERIITIENDGAVEVG